MEQLFSDWSVSCSQNPPRYIYYKNQTKLVSHARLSGLNHDKVLSYIVSFGCTGIGILDVPIDVVQQVIGSRVAAVDNEGGAKDIAGVAPVISGLQIKCKHTYL